MHKYLPSKRFSYIFLSLILALGIVCAVSFFSQPKEIQITTLKAETKDKIQEFMTLDSDKDGMKDWEEALWKTDPKKADTDGDGTSDSEEIKLNRDPLKTNTAPQNATPNDKIDEKIIAAEKKSDEDFNKLTVTEKMGRELFSQYVATKKIDSALTTTDQANIIGNAISNLPKISLRNYSEAEITTINSSDNETLRNYTNSISQIILTNLKTESESLDTIITDLANIESDTKVIEKNAEIFQRLDPLINKNHKTVLDLLKLPVPKVLVSEHLNLLNSFQEIYEGLDLMQKSASDIVVIIPLLDQYDLSVQKLTDSLTKIVNKISSLKVVFLSTADYGYQLFNVIMLNK